MLGLRVEVSLVCFEGLYLAGGCSSHEEGRRRLSPSLIEREKERKKESGTSSKTKVVGGFYFYFWKDLFEDFYYV